MKIKYIGPLPEEKRSGILFKRDVPTDVEDKLGIYLANKTVYESVDKKKVEEKPKMKKYTIHEFYKMNREEQEEKLKEFGMTAKEINKLGKEDELVNALMELQNKED